MYWKSSVNTSSTLSRKRLMIRKGHTVYCRHNERIDNINVLEKGMSDKLEMTGRRGKLSKRIVSIFWKLYFWLFCVSMFVYYIDTGLTTVGESIDLAVSIPSLIALFLYAYEKRLFSAGYWKLYCLLFLIWELYHNISAISWDGFTAETALDLLFGFMFFTPLYISLYLYAFRRTTR